MNKMIIRDNDNIAVGLCVHQSKALITVFLSLTVSCMTYVQERQFKSKGNASHSLHGDTIFVQSHFKKGYIS